MMGDDVMVTRGDPDAQEFKEERLWSFPPRLKAMNW